MDEDDLLAELEAMEQEEMDEQVRVYVIVTSKVWQPWQPCIHWFRVNWGQMVHGVKWFMYG